MSDDPIARVKAALRDVQKPKKLPTEEDLTAAAKDRFSDLLRTVTRLNAAVKIKYDSEATVTVEDWNAKPSNSQVTGKILARKSGTKPSHAPRKEIPFVIQGGAIVMGGTKGSFPGGKQASRGARYESTEQSDLINKVVDVLIEFYQSK